jgi:hypothetical protein
MGKLQASFVEGFEKTASARYIDKWLRAPGADTWRKVPMTPKLKELAEKFRNGTITPEEMEAAELLFKMRTTTFGNAGDEFVNAFINGFKKIAGGPGSGVTGDNTKKIDILPHSPIISIGKRKKFMSNRSPEMEKVQVLVENIKYKGQEKYVPKKLKKFMDAISKGETWMWEKPVILLRDRKGDLHIIDGHHRALAAILSKRKSLSADVYSDNVFHKAVNTMKKTAEEKQKFVKEEKDDKDRSRRTYMFGYNNPVTGLNTERLDLRDEDKKPRPEAFN